MTLWFIGAGLGGATLSQSRQKTITESDGQFTSPTIEFFNAIKNSIEMHRWTVNGITR